MRLNSTTVVVTGGASGIGRATARRCAEEGATVVVTDVDEDGGERAAEELDETAGAGTFRSLDVRDEDAVASVLNAVDEEHGLDVLVNNAGIGHPPADIEDVEGDVFERILDINVRGVWNGCRAALPIMKERGEGSIVNMASLAGFLGLRKQGAYSLTKGAVLNFTRAVAVEAGSHGVRANAVCPGYVETDLAQPYFELLGEGDPELGKQRMIRSYPMKRLAQPEEVADCVLFLASDESSFVTGHGLVVDGGYSVS